MIKILKYSFLLSISFLISFELLSSFSINSNKLYVNVKEPNVFSESEKETVYLIGDSYAKTSYVNEGYPKIFKKHFNSVGLNFVDLSENGSELDTHKKLLDSLNILKPKLIIYYYNLGDIIGLKKLSQTSINREIETSKAVSKGSNNSLNSYNKQKDVSIYKYLSDLALKSKSIGLIKDAIQYTYVLLTDKPSPKSSTYKYSLQNKENSQNIKDLFNSIQSEQVIILITTPFNYGIKPKKWEQYSVFKNMILNDNILLIQSVDIVNDPKLAVSWRNGHPNQEAIKILSNSILHLYQNINTKY
jgi:hypothetical protein